MLAQLTESETNHYVREKTVGKKRIKEIACEQKVFKAAWSCEKSMLTFPIKKKSSIRLI